jgi:predicted lipid-binding transport protein (Tim44 family)
VSIDSIAQAVIWLMALGTQYFRDLMLVGLDVEEYCPVLTATLWIFGIIAVPGLVAIEQMTLLRQMSQQQMSTDKQAEQVRQESRSTDNRAEHRHFSTRQDNQR